MSSTPTQSELRRLAAANPVDQAELEAGIDTDRAWASIEARLAADPRPRRHPPRHRRRRTALAIGGIALVVSIVLALTPSHRDRHGRVARVLDAAAAVASTHTGPSRSAGSPFLYVESESADLVTFGDGGGWSALVKTRRQEWAAADGSGRLRETRTGPIFLGKRDEDRSRAAAPKLGGGSSDRAVRAGTLGDEDLGRWSTDPARLRAQLEDRAKRGDAPRNVELLVLAGDLLRQAGAPPKLRAALYRAAARIPGVTILDHVRDPAGREGTGIAITSSYGGDRERYALIFDARTSMLLGEETRLLERVPYVDAEPPALIEYTVYLRYEPVASTRTCPRNASCD